MKKLLGIMGFLAVSASAFAGLFDMYVVDGDKAYSVGTYATTPGEYQTAVGATIGKFATQDIYIYDSAENKAISVAAYAGAGATDIVAYMAIGTDVKSSIAQGVKVYNADLTLGDYVPGLGEVLQGGIESLGSATLIREYDFGDFKDFLEVGFDINLKTENRESISKIELILEGAVISEKASPFSETVSFEQIIITKTESLEYEIKCLDVSGNLIGETKKIKFNYNETTKEVTILEI